MKQMIPQPQTHSIRLRPLWLALLAAAGPLCGRADQDLVNFGSGLDLARVTATDAKFSPAAGGLRVNTGHQQPWPGITLPAPKGFWDLSPNSTVGLRVRNLGTNPVTVFCRVDNAGADGTDRCVTGSVKLGAGVEDTVLVPLKRTSNGTLNGQLFGMRGYPAALGGSGTIDPAKITQVLVFLTRPAEDHRLEIQRLRAVGTYTAPTAWVTDSEPFFPFVDTLGQYRHKTWPGKVQTVAELDQRRQMELKELAKYPGPADWDKYGGWQRGPRLPASGFFRTAKHEGKWWLVDPEGRLFFSHGVDCVGALDATPIDERANWFEDFPGADPIFAEFFSQGHALKGHYAGRHPRSFSFAGANLRRKYGSDWARLYPGIIQRRLRSWGLNTIGNWSERNTIRLRQTAYTDTIGSSGAKMIQGSEGYWGKFPDVFDPSFAEGLRRGMDQKKNSSAGDPWCIGYFSDNEMSWGDEHSLALAALKSPADQACKQVFLTELKDKYGDIAALNAAWGTTNASWEGLLENRDAPEPSKAAADLAGFYSRMAEEYFRTVREVIKTVAPNQLYLGCRFAWVNARAAAAAARYCDVVSYNIYQRSVAHFQFNGGADVPLLIGEFHLGALDRGLFHTGLVPVSDQNARAQAYLDYVRGALQHPQFVGCHWFQYQDEPLTGRVYDEENYQIGLVDVADTPYAETIAALRDVGSQLYSRR